MLRLDDLYISLQTKADVHEGIIQNLLDERVRLEEDDVEAINTVINDLDQEIREHAFTYVTYSQRIAERKDRKAVARSIRLRDLADNRHDKNVRLMRVYESTGLETSPLHVRHNDAYNITSAEYIASTEECDGLLLEYYKRHVHTEGDVVVSEHIEGKVKSLMEKNHKSDMSDLNTLQVAAG